MKFSDLKRVQELAVYRKATARFFPREFGDRSVRPAEVPSLMEKAGRLLEGEPPADYITNSDMYSTVVMDDEYIADMNRMLEMIREVLAAASLRAEKKLKELGVTELEKI